LESISKICDDLMSYIRSYGFFLTPEKRILQSGLDTQVDVWAESFKRALDDVVSSFREDPINRLEILPPKNPSARYDAPWQAKQEVPRNGLRKWVYEIGGTGITIGDLQFEMDALGLRVRFSTPLNIAEEQFGIVLRNYAERLRSPSPQ